MRALGLILVLVTLLLGGCKARPAKQVDDPWGYARSALTEPKNCFAHQPAYCLSDPELLDEVLREVIDKEFAGEIPTTDKELERLVQRASWPYKKVQRTPEGVAQIEALIQARYDNPVITATEREVHVDLGYVPGTLSVSDRHGMAMDESPLIAGFEWSVAEMATQLLAAAADYPEGARVVDGRELLPLRVLELVDAVAPGDGDAVRGVEIGDERPDRERPARRAGRDLGSQVGRQRGQGERDRREVRPVVQRASELLEQHRLLDEREACAALLLGDRDAGPAELGEIGPGRLRGGGEERARLLAKLVLLWGEGEVHQRDLGRPRTRSATMLRRISEVPASMVLPRLRSCWYCQ